MEHLRPTPSLRSTSTATTQVCLPVRVRLGRRSLRTLLHARSLVLLRLRRSIQLLSDREMGHGRPHLHAALPVQSPQ